MHYRIFTQTHTIMKALLSIALLAIGLVPAFGEDLDREEKALREFDKALPQILENFNHEMPCQEFAALYAHYDYDGDGFPEMVVSNNDTTRTVFYKIKDGFPRRISADFTGMRTGTGFPTITATATTITMTSR